MSLVRFKLSYILCAALCVAVITHCAVSPKYRHNSSPVVTASDLPLTRSGTHFDIPGELWDAPSLQTIYGVASWYGEPFHGRQTANGERYDMNRNSAAHKTLPFGTWVRVTNLKNNRVILTRINDRGPFIKGREIDLSRGAADALDMRIDGISQVKIEVVRWGVKK